MMAANTSSLLTNSVQFQLQHASDKLLLLRAPGHLGARFPSINLRSDGAAVQAKTRGRSITAILLPPAANEDFTYGRRAKKPTTSIVNKDVWQFLQNPTGVRIAKKRLLPEHPTLDPAEKKQEEELKSRIDELVVDVRQQLSCIRSSRGEISVSAYDTAWVARIPDAEGGAGPQFPRTLEWIVANQHADGSWGDELNHWLYDRFIQTLSCIVALKSWNHSPSSVQRGIEYIQNFADILEDDDIIRMPIGFELSFPALLAEAKGLELDLPYNTQFFQVLERLREEKLRRVPLRLLHSQPTTLLHTLEGIQSLDIDWDQVLKFKSEDGSMCCSPSSTAVLYMHTGDQTCLSFLTKTVQTFNNAVPTCYPLDTFHNLWVVDTLERLGISRYFPDEIREILSLVYRNWSDQQGICWASVLKDVPDLDDTSMAFRLLRKHGYSVSAEAFKVFQKEKKFACFAVGQMVQGTSDMYNLFRASQTSHPGEDILDDATEFSKGFLVDALTKNKGNVDKWSLKKDLAGELEYALKYPPYKSLKRMEVRNYLDKYGPEDAWIGKSIYRLRLVNNHNYLYLAKADFNLSQMLHKRELLEILHWISNSGIADSSSVRERMVMLYAMFAAEVWEPELSELRMAAGKSMFIAMAMYQLFNQQSSLTDLRQLVEAIQRWDPSMVQKLPEKFSSCFMMLYNTINSSANESAECGDHVGQLVHIWGQLLSSFMIEAEWLACSTTGAYDQYQKIISTASGLEAIALSSVLISGEVKSPHFVTWMAKDPTFLRSASEAVMLAQRIAAVKNKDPGHLGSLAALHPKFMQESKQSASPMQVADARFTSMKEQINKDLSWQEKQLSTVPQIVKRVVLSFTKVANVYYDRNYSQESLFELQRLLVSPVE